MASAPQFTPRRPNSTTSNRLVSPGIGRTTSDKDGRQGHTRSLRHAETIIGPGEKKVEGQENSSVPSEEVDAGEAQAGGRSWTPSSHRSWRQFPGTAVNTTTVKPAAPKKTGRLHRALCRYLPNMGL
ncbi:uncharacterized protein SPSK_04667 [Sporothrix schenckii 1099-18]|uniref:Uncharacterized protein n=1 Tax=Sporothrix schenckii 1099-18 TaxID=1397361 RepID=A0A0F2M1M5_SPOSC|nr:uncharacterized protein SPSK_04667 [Sporothrix schenckii 1099-18]KJR82984.1 hypothetical protein SPSK_04667 [Sporothrix schenckii 1099-18]